MWYEHLYLKCIPQLFLIVATETKLGVLIIPNPEVNITSHALPNDSYPAASRYNVLNHQTPFYLMIIYKKIKLYQHGMIIFIICTYYDAMQPHNIYLLFQ